MTAPHYLYRLHIDIEPTDVRVLRDGLAGEAFGLRDRLGAGAIEKQLEDFKISVDADSEERWPDFDSDIEVLSTYISQYISGYEIRIEPTPGAPRLRGWKVAARLGDVQRLAVNLSWDAGAQQVVIGNEDLDDVRERWADLPEWLQSALRLSHPELGAL